MRFKDLNSSYIDGQWVRGPSTFEVVNPATGEILAEVADLSRAQIGLGIDAAAKAFPTWSSKTSHERAIVLKRWSSLINSNNEALAQLMTAEQGKPLAEAQAEISYARFSAASKNRAAASALAS